MKEKTCFDLEGRLAKLWISNSHWQHAMVVVSNWGRSFFSVSNECLAAIFDKLEKNISSKTKKRKKIEIKITNTVHLDTRPTV